jgi:hypothetical protein
MSLQLAAQHLAAQGRGPDTQLIHMSPREVAGLQALAMAHGGSLSINPETGLPEAGFLDNLLPAIIGAGLMFATGGAAGAAIIPGLSNAATIGLGVGALQTARTGDLGKGIMAGLGAYGGAGLGAGLAGGPGMTVANPQAAQIAAAQATPAAQAGVTGLAGAPYDFGAATAAEQAVMQEAIAAQAAPMAQAGAISPSALQAAPISAQEHLQAMSQLSAPPTVTPSVTPEFVGNTPKEAFRASEIAARNADPTFAERFKAMPGKDLAKYGLAAAAPVLLEQPKYNQPELDREQMRFAYSPGRVEDPEAGYTGASTGERMYFQPQYTRLADGGTVENMSNANVYDMQRVRGGVSDLGVDMSTGQERMAAGGMSHLGDYSDGGRLLRGPGDGVSDSIPATIANKRPARLADGEFVIPARIVSELGNGSTEAGARKLYAMMDRVQRARGKTTGKGKVAKNTRAEKYLPA